MPDKKEIRKEMLSRLRALDVRTREDKSVKIKEVFLASTFFSTVRHIAAYMPMAHEVNIEPVLRAILEKGSALYLPKSHLVDKSMVFYRVEELDRLTAGPMGIWEPDARWHQQVSIDVFDLVIVPGVAFDVDKNRLGHGGGFYDRFLPLLKPAVKKIALAYDFQIVDSLPVVEYDSPVDAVVTESRIL